MSDHIDDYLETISRDLRGPVIESHRTLLETEDHLRSSVADFMHQGMSEDDAQLQAISQFGVADEFARAHNAEVRGFSPIGSFVALATKAVELVSVAFVAIGVSAGIAYLASIFTSVKAVFGMPIGAIPSVQQCSYWLGLHPTAVNCQQAGTWEAAHDMTWMLGALGILGAALLFGIRRWKRSRFYFIESLPSILSPAIATPMFFVAAVALFAFGQSDAVIVGSWGKGMWYSESVTSFAAFLVSAFFLVRAIREPFHKIES